MDSAKQAIKESISFESLFDENSPTITKEFFRDELIKEIQLTGHGIEIEVSEDGSSDILVKKIDEHSSQNYMVFGKHEDYKEWLGQSLYEPSEEEIMEALKNGAGT